MTTWRINGPVPARWDPTMGFSLGVWAWSTVGGPVVQMRAGFPEPPSFLPATHPNTQTQVRPQVCPDFSSNGPWSIQEILLPLGPGGSEWGGSPLPAPREAGTPLMGTSRPALQEDTRAAGAWDSCRDLGGGSEARAEPWDTGVAPPPLEGLTYNLGCVRDSPARAD